MTPLDYTCSHAFPDRSLCMAAPGEACKSSVGGRIEGFHAERIMAANAHDADGGNAESPAAFEANVLASGLVD